MFAVIAQFFYVGAQVCIWSYLIRYGQDTVPGTGEKTLANYLLASLIIFMIGRFMSTALMFRVRAAWLMWIYAIINVLLCAYAIFYPGHSGLLALVATSFFMSLMFPTIFALGVKGLGSNTKLGGSFIIMAIIGGAVWTPVMGLIADRSNLALAMLIPLIAYLFIGYYSFVGAKPGGPVVAGEGHKIVVSH